MGKLGVIFGFTIGELILGVLAGAVLGNVVFNAFFKSAPAIEGVFIGGIIGVLVGGSNGLLLGTVTALRYYPLQQRKNYHPRMILLSLGFTAMCLLVLMAIASTQGDDRSVVQLGMSGVLMGVPIALFSTFIAAGLYMRTQSSNE